MLIKPDTSRTSAYNSNMAGVTLNMENVKHSRNDKGAHQLKTPQENKSHHRSHNSTNKFYQTQYLSNSIHQKPKATATSNNLATKYQTQSLTAKQG